MNRGRNNACFSSGRVEVQSVYSTPIGWLPKGSHLLDRKKAPGVNRGPLNDWIL
jgi:hypothetical protein